MWDPQTGIEVRIKPYGSKDPYQEYKAPTNSKLFAQDRNECFIEAVADERYTIEVIVHPLFQWQRSPPLSVDYKLDGGMVYLWGHLDNPRKKEAVSDELKSFKSFIDGTRTKCGLTFGAVSLVDDPTFLSQGEEEAELSRRGKIEIILQRGKYRRRKRTRSEIEDSENLETMFMPSMTTKKVAGDNGRSHYLKPVVLENITQSSTPSTTTNMWTKAKDEAGQEMAFTFYYTTREYLEINNVIPIIKYANTGETAIDVEQEVQGWNAPGAARKPPNNATHQGSIQDVTFVSTKHLGNGAARIKIEPDAGLEKKPLGHRPAYLTNEKAYYDYKSRDRDDTEPPPYNRVWQEPQEDLYNATPMPPGRGGFAAKSGPAGAMLQDPKEKRKADIRRRLEEIQLQKELEELERGEDGRE